MITFVFPYECRGKFDVADEAIDRLRAGADSTNWPLAIPMFRRFFRSVHCNRARILHEPDDNF